MEKPQRPLGTVAGRAMPTVIFTHWREALNEARLSAAARGGYALAIGSYLDYCRRNGLSVTLESARGFVSDAQPLPGHYHRITRAPPGRTWSRSRPSPPPQSTGATA